MMSVDFVICNPRPMHSWSPVHERCLLLGTVGQDGDDDDDPCPPIHERCLLIEAVGQDDVDEEDPFPPNPRAVSVGFWLCSLSATADSSLVPVCNM